MFAISIVVLLLSVVHVHAHASHEQDTLAWQQLPGSLYGSSQAWGLAADASWPQSDIGQPLQPQAPDSELTEMLAQVDPIRIQQIVTNLTNFRTRHTLSTQNSSTEGIGAARNWILKEMQALAQPSNGNMEVFLNSYIQGIAERISFPVNISNIIAQINGTDDPTRAYVVTGHYDSRRINIMDYTGDAPGADDDATGVAVVMELARICATKRPKATMFFAAVAGEEQDLYGSAHLAKTLNQQGYNVEGNWNNDIVGTGKSEPYSPINDHTIRLFGASIFYPNASTANDQEETAIIGSWNDSPSQNLGRYIAEVTAGAAMAIGMQVALIYRPDRVLRGGDHESFLAEGFPAVRFTEAVEDFTHQHQDPRMYRGHQYGDLIEYVDFDYTARVARTNLASMWSAANAPAMPQNVTMSEIVGFPAAHKYTSYRVVEGNSQFCWNTGNDTLVSGYELVWRPSGNLQWTHSLSLGNVNNATVLLSKDDVQFGIRAVGADGKKSPAVFPFPADTTCF